MTSNIVTFEAGGSTIRLMHSLISGSKQIFVDDILVLTVKSAWLELESVHQVPISDEVLVALTITPRGLVGFKYTAKITKMTQTISPFYMALHPAGVRKGSGK